MREVAVFSLGGLTALVAWRLILGPLFHGFMRGLTGREDPDQWPQLTTRSEAGCDETAPPTNCRD